MIPAYKKFKENLRGWTDVSFPVFRELVLPMRDKKQWSDDKKKEITKIVENGGGHALFILYGNHPGSGELSKILETILKIVLKKKEPIPMEDKKEAESDMNAVLASCKRADWKPALYREWVTFLESSMTISELPELRMPSTAGTLFQESKAPEDTKKEKLFDDDLFSSMFRNGSKQYRDYVRKRILDAAEVSSADETQIET